MAKLENLGDKNRNQNYPMKCCMISLVGTLFSAPLFTIAQKTIQMITVKDQLLFGASLDLSQNLLMFISCTENIV